SGDRGHGRVWRLRLGQREIVYLFLVLRLNCLRRVGGDLEVRRLDLPGLAILVVADGNGTIDAELVFSPRRLRIYDELALPFGAAGDPVHHHAFVKLGLAGRSVDWPDEDELAEFRLVERGFEGSGLGERLDQRVRMKSLVDVHDDGPLHRLTALGAGF